MTPGPQRSCRLELECWAVPGPVPLYFKLLYATGTGSAGATGACQGTQSPPGPSRGHGGATASATGSDGLAARSTQAAVD